MTTPGVVEEEKGDECGIGQWNKKPFGMSKSQSPAYLLGVYLNIYIYYIYWELYLY